MSLRRLFLQNQYDIRQICTEPNGILFGADEVFPYGYGSSIDLHGEDTIEYINYLMWRLDNMNPDLIIGGGQSGVSALCLSNLSAYNLPTLHFLYGFNPDAVILCINYHDQLADIRRTITFIEGTVGCKVIALSLFPYGYKAQWNQYNAVKSKLTPDEAFSKKAEVISATDIPCVLLGEALWDQILFSCVIDHFSQSE